MDAITPRRPALEGPIDLPVPDEYADYDETPVSSHGRQPIAGPGSILRTLSSAVVRNGIIIGVTLLLIFFVLPAALGAAGPPAMAGG